MITMNTRPYFDDYDPDKNYYQILFKPGMAVQARELTQMQTLLQSQIERFGQHVFKDGSIVIGGKVTLEKDVPYVKISNSFTIENLNKFVGTKIRNVNGVKAIIYAVAHKDNWPGINNNILLIKYISGSLLDGSGTFKGSEKLYDIDRYSETNANLNTSIFDIVSSNPIGIGSVFSIEPGIVFSRGYFISFLKQRLVVDPVTNTPTCKIGFDSNPEIITAGIDETLLDNAQGSYNYAAPGADRLKLAPLLVKTDIDDNVSLPKFIPVMVIKKGVILEEYVDSQYAKLGGELARRTYEESGDYVVNGFNVDTREWLNTGTNGGLYLLTSDDIGLNPTDYLAAEISPGLAYVKGNRIIELATTYLKLKKSTDTLSKYEEIISSKYGNYIRVKNINGFINDSGIDTVQLIYINESNTAASPPTGYTGSDIPATISDITNGSIIGSAKVYFFTRDPDITTEYRVYLTDIIISDTTKSFKDIRTIVKFGSFVSNVGLTDIGSSSSVHLWVSKLQDNASNINQTLLFPINVNAIKTTTLRTDNNNTIISNTIFDTKRTFSTTISTGIFSISVSCGENEVIKGAFSSPDLDVEVSDYTSHFTVSRDDVFIDIGTINVKCSSSPNTVYISNANASEFAEGTYKISFYVTKTITQPRVKTINTGAMIKVKVINSLEDRISLGYSDIHKIQSIKKYVGADNYLEETDPTKYVDVTYSFIINNGQTDTSYDHGYITPIANSGIALNDLLLVTFDYFDSSNTGYFAAESYSSIPIEEIPIYISANTGKTYDLRNSLDFRYIKANTGTLTTLTNNVLSVYSSNPGATNTVIANHNIPSPTSGIIFDYSYYLARRDVVGINSIGEFVIISGEPSVAPISPKVPSNVMGLANLYIPPYPSIASTYAIILGIKNQGVITTKIASDSYTMKDIGVLKQRIETLEYYNALTLLEKSATNLKVTDAYGNDRFKNGFFVDGFLDHSLGATSNRDYNISVDKIEQSIRPKFIQQSFNLLLDESNNTGVQRLGDLVTLKYDSITPEITFIDQSRVSTTRNIEQAVFRFVGKTKIYPEEDVWPTTQLPVLALGDTTGGDGITSTTEWGEWQKTTGYDSYLFDRAERVGTFSSYEDAVRRSVGGGNLPLETILTSFNDSFTRNPGGMDQVVGRVNTVETSTRSGIKTTVNTSTKTEDFGNLLKDVSINEYVRPQVLKIFCQGIKPNTKFFVFFDSENMTAYTTPGTSNTSDPADIIIALNSDNSVKTEGLLNDTSQLVSDNNGELRFLLRLPLEKPFRAGTKEIVITDNPTNSVDTVSWSKGYFISNALVKTYQNLTISTKTSIPQVEKVSETVSKVTEVNRFFVRADCMAYSFLINEANTVPGIFLSSVDIWIAAKHASLGIWFEIREMDSGGSVTQVQVPMSEIWYKSSEITLSPSMSSTATPHRVQFKSPIYLKNNTQYAFVMHTEGVNPDYYFWISRLGETDLITNNQITNRANTGTVFASNNNLTWDKIPDIDLKVRFNRANFDTRTATVNIVEGDYDFFEVTKPTADLKLGEQFISRKGVIEAILTNISESTAPAIGQVIKIGTVTIGTISAVDNNDNTWILDIDIPVNSAIPTILKIGTAIQLYVGTALSGYSGTINSVSYGSGFLLEYSRERNRSTNVIKNLMILKNSNGLFEENIEIFGIQSGQVVTIESINDWDYSTINYKPNHLIPDGTSCSYGFLGTLSTGEMTDTTIDAAPDSSFSFNEQYTIKSKSGNDNKSTKIIGTLETNSPYVSPVIDLSRINSIFIRNITNNLITENDKNSELMPFGGVAINKYISKTVTLADGQDAEDLLVTLTSYIPIGTNIRVYMKVSNALDPVLIDMRPWIEMTRNKIGVNSSSVNKNDFIEFEYNVPETNMVNGILTYTSTEGFTYTGFKQFAIKIVLLATDAIGSTNSSAIVPRVADLRVIALQK